MQLFIPIQLHLFKCTTTPSLLIQDRFCEKIKKAKTMTDSSEAGERHQQEETCESRKASTQKWQKTLKNRVQWGPRWVQIISAP